MAELPFDIKSIPANYDFAAPSSDPVLEALLQQIEKPVVVPPEELPPEVLGLPKVQGHQITLQEWNAFEAYLRTPGKLKDIAAAAGITDQTLRAYRKTAWWKTLHEEHVAEAQEDLHTDLLALRGDAVQAVKDTLRGNLDAKEEGKYAGAMIKAADLLTKIGKNPLQDNRSQTNIDARSIINTGTIHLTKEKLETLDQDEMLKMITGEVKIEG